MAKFKWVVGALAALLLGGAAYYIHEEPAMGMYVCPSCYGFEKSASGIYLDTSISVSDAREIEAMHAAAIATVGTFYGKFSAEPVSFICGSAACDARLNYRGAKAKAFGSAFILVYSRGRSTMFLTHEYSHVELAERIGTQQVIQSAIPAWFNEGVAVLVSNDTRSFTLAPDRTRNCITEPQDPVPVTVFEWSRATHDRDRPIYAEAACAVLGWMEKNGGEDGIRKMISRVADGKDFE